MSQTNEFLKKIYKVLTTVREDMDDIKSLLIQEVEPTEEEEKEILEGLKEIKDGKTELWNSVKKELESN